MATTFVALSSTHSDCYVELIGDAGESKDNVTSRAERRICGEFWGHGKDIEIDTALKNLHVVSLSEANRQFPDAMRRYVDHSLNPSFM